MEQFWNKHILEHLNSIRIFPVSQHGFVNGKSIETNMLECLNDWKAAVADKKTIDIVDVDIVI